MNSENANDLGGPLKKPADKLGSGKPLGGGLAPVGKSIGSDAPASAPATPPAPLAYEFDDAPPAKADSPNPAPAPAPSFNPFDEPVEVPPSNVSMIPIPDLPGIGPVPQPNTSRINKPPTSRIDKTTTGRVEKTGTGRIEKTGTGRIVKPSADAGDGDIAPGMAKDLWTCPHCGAKNKPHRETCRECKKSPQDPVAKPWFLQPPILGSVVGGLALVVALFVWLTNVDLSLRPAGSLDKAVRSDGIARVDVDLGESRKFTIKKAVAVSGRAIHVNDYPVAPWLQTVVVGLGSSASDDAAFSTWTAEFDGDGMKVNAPKYATLFLIHDSSKPLLKTGDYISVVGKAGVVEQDHMIIKGTDNPNCWVIKVEQIETR